jgi:hypothetical protein
MVLENFSRVQWIRYKCGSVLRQPVEEGRIKVRVSASKCSGQRPLSVGKVIKKWVSRRYHD